MIHLMNVRTGSSFNLFDVGVLQDRGGRERNYLLCMLPHTNHFACQAGF